MLVHPLGAVKPDGIRVVDPAFGNGTATVANSKAKKIGPSFRIRTPRGEAPVWGGRRPKGTDGHLFRYGEWWVLSPFRAESG
jgi:hypothetical protein